MPDISIITPWLDRPEFIPDYERAVAAPGVEVIVVDNGSANANAKALSDMVGRLRGKYIRNEENRWFAAANNQGLAVASGEIIIFLNNDIAADPSWVDQVRRDVKPGAIYGTGRGEVTIDGRRLNYLAGWCIGARRLEINRLGGWDAVAFEMPYWEDADLCVRALRAGMQLVRAGWPLQHKQNGTSVAVPGLFYAFQRNLEILTSRLRGTAPPPTVPCNEPNDYIRHGRVAEGERVYAQAVRSEPLRPDLWARYGQILEASGRFEAAEQALRRAMELDCRLAAAHDAMGMLLLRTGRPAEAATGFRTLADLNPDSAEAMARLGLALYACGDYGGSVEAGRTALRLDPTNLSAGIALSDALREVHEPQEALAVAQAVQRRYPNVADTHRAVGMALHQTNRVEEALAALKQSIALDPHSQATRAAYQAAMDKLSRG